MDTIKRYGLNAIHFITLGFGVGLLPMPGTWGTFIAIPFFLYLRLLPWQLYLSALLLLVVVGVYLCNATEKFLKKADDPRIVFDEMVGFWITMFLAPTGAYWIFLGFVLFRVFDIMKPWPINWMNRNVHKGLGIMLDDVVAGMAAFAIMQLILRFYS